MQDSSTKDILLTTLTATYQHASLGLRYLLANLDDLQERAQIIEFTINGQPREIAERILKLNPRIVGFGIYIWNTKQSYEVISILRKVRPELVIILGGPEVSHEIENQAIVALADYVIAGEADFAFRDLCRSLLVEKVNPTQKIIRASLPDIKTIKLPYIHYNAEDISHRVIYVEASRGCPYKCEYCLSSLDKSVRNFDIHLFLESLENLINKGVRQFKFIDRTFNLSITTCNQILNFFLSHIDKNLFLHFEMVPDRLPSEIRSLLEKFPEGSIQFEVGIQTLNEQVARNISRKNDMMKVEENFQFLSERTGVHTHADLIVGLPGETLTSFAQGFDSLYKMGPDEIQVGILKRLKGTPIIRHDNEFKMVYSEQPPFQILCNSTMSFFEIQQMARFAKYWDLVANSGNFKSTMALLKNNFAVSGHSPFALFFLLSEKLTERHGEGIAVSLQNLTQSLYTILPELVPSLKEEIHQNLFQDYVILGKRDTPRFMKGSMPIAKSELSDSSMSGIIPQNSVNKRQQKHIAKIETN